MKHEVRHLSVGVSHPLNMALFMSGERAGRHEGALAHVTWIGFSVQVNVLVYRERGEHCEGLPAYVALERLFVLLKMKQY